MTQRWKILFQTRHYDHAYRMLGLGYADFEPTVLPARDGDLVYDPGDGYVSRDGRFRVSAFVDEWGHSCRLVEYADFKVEPVKLAAIHERIAHELRVHVLANELYDARHPHEGDGWRVINLAEWGECADEAEALMAAEAAGA